MKTATNHRTAGRVQRIHFRCACGRSVSTESTSRAAIAGMCTDCQARDRNLMHHSVTLGLARRPVSA